uniref:Putative GTP cyclohydrolase URC1 n=1 Tax=Lachancea kluyveri TaxID=4934 RepID=URC1_LACKL|nr:RecName: Full=Putative GTP cyclohydrolase URC1; AltName: Full=Uracil catabolism protein 1 [Lachancea kluyveri]AAO06876.1 GTP cyclohydrolase [Lachancea kluyveri]
MSPIAVTSQTPATEVPSVKEIPQVITKSSPVENLILTTYPEDSSPIPLQWGAPSTDSRGPIIATRYKEGLAKHNAIGAHSGSYCVYHALAVGTKQLDPEHVADYTNSQPAFAVPEQKTWYNDEDIVAMDPFGHLTPYLFDEVSTKENVEIRPTIAVTKATMQLFEMKDAVEKGRLEVDGEVVINKNGDLNVSKVAVEPVWYLPGVAKRFGVTEEELRKALFEDTNGMYPELVTRPDIKVFLPPIGGLTVYIFGNPDFVSDPSKKLALRVHDECNGSDVFGSDICTCRPYLMFGIEEAVKEAQNGGSGVVVYFRKEGRALGEVTKYLVYNARKRGGDTADEYFHRTECIAGVRDMRFQQLMPDVLKWLGISKIDRMLSMSNMKHDAIVDQGIPIIERIPIPDELVPPDSRVEIDAKINSGYFTNGKVMDKNELKSVQGRTWNDVK